MAPASIRHRMLLVADDSGRDPLRGLVPPNWDVVEAGAVEKACFLQEGQPCELVVLGGPAAPCWGEGLAWLARLVSAPLVLVTEVAVEPVLEAMRHGALWMPADIARRHPELLAGLFAQAVRVGEERRRAVQATAQLKHCSARVDRLLGLLWEAAPGEGPMRWFSQRHMLERLDEEVARARRRGAPLSLVLGEMRPESGGKLDAEDLQRVGGWLARQIIENKRRCDVAGQYGLGGFMLVLPLTSSEEAAGACRRLRGVLEHSRHEALPPVHACFGTASVPADAPSVQALLRRAEERLEQAPAGPDGA